MRFKFGYSEEEYGFVYFDAESLEEAEALLQQVKDDEIDLVDLPASSKRINGGTYEYIYLEEVK